MLFFTIEYILCDRDFCVECPVGWDGLGIFPARVRFGVVVVFHHCMVLFFVRGERVRDWRMNFFERAETLRSLHEVDRGSAVDFCVLRYKPQLLHYRHSIFYSHFYLLISHGLIRYVRVLLLMQFQNMLLFSIEKFLACDNAIFFFHECLVWILVMMSLNDTITRVDISSNFLFHFFDI